MFATRLCCSLALLLGIAIDAAGAQSLPTERAISGMLAEGDVAAVSAAGTTLAAECSSERSPIVCYRAAYAHYVRALLTMPDDRDAASDAVVACGTTLAPLGSDPALAGEAKALLSGCYGLAIAMNPAKGMSLGPDAARLVAEALKHAPDSARVHYFSALRLVRTPPMWGGDPNKALLQLRRAQELITAQAVDAVPGWGAAEIGRLLGEVELELMGD